MKKRGRRLFSEVFIFAALLLLLCACGREKGTKGLCYILQDDNTYSVSIGEATQESEIVIPSTYRRKTVSSVAPSGFSKCDKLKKITITKGVSEIGSSAFSGCTSLESVKIADSVKSIGGSAFYGCEKLSEITLPFVGEKSNGNGATNFGFIFGAVNTTYHESYVPQSLKTVVLTKTESIDESAFYYCNPLVSVTLPEELQSIGNSAFRECHRLIEVCNNSALSIKSGETENGFVGFYAQNIYSASSGESHIARQNGFVFFYQNGVGSLIGYEGSKTELILPDSFTAYNGAEITSYRVGENAFSFNAALVSVVFSSAVTSIGNGAFENCTSLVSVFLDEGMKNIGDNAFCGCEVLSVLTLPVGISEIGEAAFRGCWALSVLTIPQGVTKLKRETLHQCTGLVTLTLPNSVTALDDLSCGYCKSLQTVIFGGTKAEFLALTKNSTWHLGTAAYTISCTDGTLQKADC